MSGIRLITFIILSFFMVSVCIAQQSNGVSSNQKSARTEIDVVRAVPAIPNEMILEPSDFQGIEGRSPTREQLDDIRNYAARSRNTAIISSIGPDECLAPGASFTITGTGFNTDQGSQSVYLSLRGVDIVQAEIVSWSDTEIVARAPGVERSGRYSVGIKNGDGRYTSNINRTARHCIIEIGGIGYDGVATAALVETCHDIDRSEAGVDVVCDDDSCRVVDHGRSVFDYGEGGGRYSRKAFDILFFILDEEIDQQCLGPIRVPWIDSSGTVRREYPPFMYWKRDGEVIPRVTGSLTWNFLCRPPLERTSVAWDRLEIELLPSGNWGVGWREIRGGRRFWFNTLTKWQTEEDANWVRRAHEELGLRLRCLQRLDRATGEFQFWSQ